MADLHPGVLITEQAQSTSHRLKMAQEERGRDGEINLFPGIIQSGKSILAMEKEETAHTGTCPQLAS